MKSRLAEALPGLWNEPNRRRVGPYVVFLLMIGATIPWRSKDYFEGGLDSVVVLKAILSLAALVLALQICSGRPTRELRVGPAVFLALYLTCTVLGGWSQDALAASAVVAVRVALLAVVLGLLARCFDGILLIGCLMMALATFAVVAAVTGLFTLTDGRLRGGFPPLHPNELASTCALVILWCIWKLLAARDTWFHFGALAVAVLVLFATGSRTPLIALVLAGLILVLYASAFRPRTILIALVATPVLFWLAAGTSLLSNVITRGDGAAGLTTLSNRTIAWEAALTPKDSPWLTWLGGGLSMKRIEVPGQWWNEQILDSSWVSALVQGGIIGLGICVVWVLHTMLATIDSPTRMRALQLALLVYLASRGLLESGLFDASTAFLVFFLTAVVTPVPARWRVPPGFGEKSLVEANG